MNNYYALFPSIITESTCNLYKSIQNDLVDWIYNYKKNTKGVTISNRGGWQSPSNFYYEESFSGFLDYIQMRINSTSIYDHYPTISNMWINVNEKNNYNVSHVHPGSILSGVIWIKCPDNCGVLGFENPNYFAHASLIKSVDKEIREGTNFFDNYSIVPEDGKMLLFPSNLRHSVEPNLSDEDRISIAFNLTANFG
jgi:uncharacterized protein (TIGR02466 family)